MRLNYFVCTQAHSPFVLKHIKYHAYSGIGVLIIIYMYIHMFCSYYEFAQYIDSAAHSVNS